MSLLRSIAGGLRSLFRKEQVSNELDEELNGFLEMAAEEKIKQGMNRQDALRAVRLERGSLEVTKEVVRDAGWESFLDTCWQDLRFGFRTLAKSPGFTAVALLTLALSIGANTAIFTLINAVMLRALPVQYPEQLVAVGNPARVHSWGGGTPRIDVFSYPLYREVRDNNIVFSSVLASSQLENLRINIDPGPENVIGRLVTENYFQTLGVGTLLGRTFTADEDRTPGADPVLVISYAYWRGRFAGDPSVIGRKVRLNNYPFTIIGIAPPGFFGEVVGDHLDVWVPMMMQAQILPGREFLEDANTASVLLIARLKPGVTMEQARTNVNAVVAQALMVTLDARLSSDDRNAVRKMKIAVQVSPGGRGLSRLREVFETPLLLLMAMVLLVLLVACVNIANLMLARSEPRQREIAIRVAMGAGPSRIVRQLLTESMLLAFVGGGLGLLLTKWGSAALVNLAYSGRNTSSPLSLGLDWRVLGFAVVVCLASGMLFGLAPALRVLHAKLGRSLKEGVRDFGTGPNSRIGRVLAASQIALGVLVLMTAGLLVRSLRNLQEADLGYSRERLLLAPIDLFGSGYKGPAIQSATRELLLRFSNLPGVRSVTASSNGLFSGNESSDSVRVEGGAAVNQRDNVTADDEVGPNYFSTIGVPIVLGREITQQDFSTAARVVVVNETFANFYFAGQNPLGHMVHIQDSTLPEQSPYELIGVARDVRDHSVRDVVRRRLYAPLTSATFDDTGLINFEIRAVGNPEMLINSVRSATRTLNTDLVVGDIKTARELVTDTLIFQVLVARLSAFFGAVILVLVCLGLYGSMSYKVAARTKEIGLRMALGAPSRSLIWMVMREACMALVIGFALGIPAGIASTRLFQAMLFGISRSDPLSIASSMLVLIAICVTAAIIPVRRATRIDPMVALRFE
jgi:predicted permease